MAEEIERVRACITAAQLNTLQQSISEKLAAIGRKLSPETERRYAEFLRVKPPPARASDQPAIWRNVLRVHSGG